MRNFQLPGRSPVYGTRQMCATSHPAASLAAADMLRSGGNAVDAAITAAAVLAVVEPQMTGIGGDCFAIVWTPGRGLTALNGAGRAPAGADVEAVRAACGTEIDPLSAHAVTVPGAVDAWLKLLSEHGTMSREAVFAPAIELARAGFPVAPRVALDWAMASEKLMHHAGARAHLMPDGRAPRAGEIIRFPELAGTLEAIVRHGRDGFYAGAVGEEIVATLRALGGTHVLDDFIGNQSTVVEPISRRYGGLEVVELPPSNQGITALMMLAMMEQFGAAGLEPFGAHRFHLAMECARLAYAARDRFVADPETNDVPVDYLLSDALIANLVSRIDPERRVADLGPVPSPPACDTTYLAVVDERGLAVSFINSLYQPFGSGIVTKCSGVVLQNRGAGFTLEHGHPNLYEPGKRPLHTLIPAMGLRDGVPTLVFGVMGGAYQPVGHVHVLMNMLDYGMDPQEALDGPRVFFGPSGLEVEAGVCEATRAGLRAMGHKVEAAPMPWGGGQMIAIEDEPRRLVGASDARKDGMAVGR